ncbi:eukaryotic translation initiation factor 3 subunit D-like [Paramacrobiotus metropolitanus]|uniref:eukaryotic translation initiation factor 3 subunit D-like n=1 Tax=Paramacrobiotus metropolitanus TaxID=2943436 RepID=UPI0024460562|nr:eukaryotic translation initiation factor 3 subunit D-like [Paramacrobiotus metropolitanus]
MASFRLPVLEGNPDGWGPTKVPEQLIKVPYQQFSKSEPLGRITDWTGALRFQGRFSQGAVPAGDQYAYVHEEDEATFQLVDSSRPARSYFSRGVGRLRSNQAFRRQRNKDFRNLADNQRDGRTQNQGQNRRGGLQRTGRQDYNRNRQFNKQREPSVPIKAEYVVIEDMEFHRMAKLSYPMKPKASGDREVDDKGKIDVGEDIVSCGALDWYDKSYDRVTVKSEKPLLRTDKPLLKHVSTTDDPVIRRLTKNEEYNVFGTDAIISTLMAASRSVYPWDIIVQRVQNKLFFDKRSKSDLDFLTVNETANEQPTEDGPAVNTPKNLSLEATLVNHTFLQQVLKKSSESEPRYKFKEPNPFVSADDLDKNVCNGYKYRKFQIADGITMVVRCTIDAVTSGPSGELNLLNVKALNEWDPRFAGVDWRSKLDTQPGAVLATEMKNNSLKLARWTLSALLAGADTLKVGFVSRANPRDPSQHAILGTQQYRPQEFANNINLNLDNAWGVLYYIIRVCMDLEEGKYLIMKDPNKPILRLYDIPDESFESENEEESDQETEKTAK